MKKKLKGGDVSECQLLRAVVLAHIGVDKLIRGHTESELLLALNVLEQAKGALAMLRFTTLKLVTLEKACRGEALL